MGMKVPIDLLRLRSATSAYLVVLHGSLPAIERRAADAVGDELLAGPWRCCTMPSSCLTCSVRRRPLTSRRRRVSARGAGLPHGSASPPKLMCSARADDAGTTWELTKALEVEMSVDRVPLSGYGRTAGRVCMSCPPDV